MLRTARTPTLRRRGISLLEVLISMFVLLVGLAGIASLLPAGRSEIMQGVKLDYAMTVGRNAFRELNARGFLKPGDTANSYSWVDGSTTYTRVWDLGALGAGGWSKQSTPFMINGTPTAAPAVVIDPLGIFSLAPSAGYDKTFPFGASTTQPFITRISPFGTLAGTNAKLLTDTIFRCGDDLNLIVNAVNKKDPPQQQILSNKRFSDGNYSWFATIVPDPTSSAVSSPVRVSVAVFYKRDLSAAGAGERTLTVNSMPGLGIGGGELILDDPGNKPLKPGQWVMLAGRRTVGGNNLDYFNWYRVVAAGDRDPSSSNRQSVTLAGTDWDAANIPPASTRVFVVDNVIAVYEKSMNLEF